MNDHPCTLADVATAAETHRTIALAWPAAGLTLHVAAVTPPAGFDGAAFARHGIDCPPHIRHAVAKRQAEYLAGRLCARAGLAALGKMDAQVATGAPPAQVGAGVLSAPVWPAGAMGSISHAQGVAMAAVLPAGACRGIGIDLERVPDTDGLQALRAVALNGAERARVDGAANADVRTTAIFSAKESFFKAVAGHVGRYFDFSAIECMHVDDRTATCIVREALAPGLLPGVTCRFDVWVDAGWVLTSGRW